MPWTNLFARLQGPLTVLVSALVIAGALVPLVNEGSAATDIRRVIATPVPVRAFTPVLIRIPKLDLEAPVVPVGTEADGKMGSPTTARDIGWWAGRKAGKGNVLLAAHHDWNGAQGSFYRLSELKEGDEVVVKGDSSKEFLTYRIVWIKNYDRNTDATELLGNKHGQVATLITCGGVFDSSAGTRAERVVARAKLVSS